MRCACFQHRRIQVGSRWHIFHFGFPTTLAEDAVSSFAPNLHAATLENFAMKFGWVAQSAEILAWLEEALPASA